LKIYSLRNLVLQLASEITSDLIVFIEDCDLEELSMISNYTLDPESSKLKQYKTFLRFFGMISMEHDKV